MSLSRLDSFQSLGPGETTSYRADRTPRTVPPRSRRRNPSFVADGVRWHHVTPADQKARHGESRSGPRVARANGGEASLQTRRAGPSSPRRPSGLPLTRGEEAAPEFVGAP